MFLVFKLISRSFFFCYVMASFKLKNDYVDNDNGLVHDCAIFKNSHEGNAAAEQLVR